MVSFLIIGVSYSGLNKQAGEVLFNNCSWVSTRFTYPVADSVGSGSAWGLYQLYHSYGRNPSSGVWSLKVGLNTQVLLQQSTETNKTDKIRPIIEIPLTSFALKPASSVSQFDYEISPVV